MNVFCIVMFKFNYSVGDIKNSDLGGNSLLGREVVVRREGSGGQGREVGEKGEGSGGKGEGSGEPPQLRPWSDCWDLEADVGFRSKGSKFFSFRVDTFLEVASPKCITFLLNMDIFRIFSKSVFHLMRLSLSFIRYFSLATCPQVVVMQ